MKLYKVTDEKGRSYNGGSGQWRLNQWRSVKGELVPCRNGLHLCRKQDLVEWLGPVIWEVEADTELLLDDNKVVARRARVVRKIDAWDKKTARLFAADCAARVLYLYERKHKSEAPRNAIIAARQYAAGKIDDAARAAAGDAAWDAAGDAAWDARDAAGDAAWDARAAAGDAAWDAAWDARAAARAAAWDAAWAARAAAWDAAGVAEKRWQTQRLFRYLSGDIPRPVSLDYKPKAGKP